MFNKVRKDKFFETRDGKMFVPVATLASKDGVWKCQITSEDGCYVIFLQGEDDYYYHTTHIFMDVFKVLKKLPELKFS